MSAGPHRCPNPACSAARVPHRRFACGRCWRLLPFELRSAIADSYDRDLSAHQTAMGEAVAWFRDHPEMVAR